jgi:cellulose biosynthesis protein BcsQ
MFDLRTSRTNAIFEQLLEGQRRRLLKTVIYKCESLNQANLAGKTVLEFAPYSRGALDYEALCDEVLRLRIPPRS